MEIRLLGPVEVLADGELVDLGIRQQRFVFAVLALEVGRVVPADRLLALLWQASHPVRARSIVHNRISGLRKAFDTIRTKGDGYLLDVDPSSIDAQRFRGLLRMADLADSDAATVALFRCPR